MSGPHCDPSPPSLLHTHTSTRPVVPLSSSWLQLFLESHLDAAQLAQLRELWRDYKQKIYGARQRYGGAALQVSCLCGISAIDLPLLVSIAVAAVPVAAAAAAASWKLPSSSSFLMRSDCCKQTKPL